MKNPRLIATVVCFDGRVIQSISYKIKFPIGDIAETVINLDRWGVDEILILSIDRSIRKLGPDFELLNKLRSMAVTTPIVYGGGISSIQHAHDVISSGADRILLESIVRGSSGNKIIKGISQTVGSQAIILSMPLVYKDRPMLFDYQTKKSYFDEELVELANSTLISEVLITDVDNEGGEGSFDFRLVEFPVNKAKMICYGGLNTSEKIKHAFNSFGVGAVSVGNQLFYKEHAYQSLKEELDSVKSIRPPIYRKGDMF